jgi:hypothetical protein
MNKATARPTRRRQRQMRRQAHVRAQVLRDRQVKEPVKAAPRKTYGAWYTSRPLSSGRKYAAKDGTLHNTIEERNYHNQHMTTDHDVELDWRDRDNASK